MKTLPDETRFMSHPAPVGPAFVGLTASLLLNSTVVFALPEYGNVWRPPSGCNKYYTTGNGHHFCVIHDMEGYYYASISYLDQCDVSASIHYAVNGLTDSTDHGAPPGEITQCVLEANYAWHVRCWNTWMFGTEHEGFANNPAWFTEAMYQASAGLQRHLCDAYAIPKDRNHIIAHGQKSDAAWVSWMATNYPSINATCNTHTDPGPYWDWSHFMALIYPPGAPIITNQPQSLTVDMGSNVLFSVTAGGNAPLYYQWLFNSSGIPGATNTTYTRSNAQPADAGSYSVLVSNQFGWAASQQATLTVETLPIITGQPQDQVVPVGQNATFAVGVSGIAPFTYQWQFNGTPLDSATNSSCLLTNARGATVGAYSVIISNRLGSALSTNANLGVVQSATWGGNDLGQSSIFGPSTNLIAIAAGGWHNLGLRADGTPIAWGNNSNGQCQVPADLTNALAVAAGGYHSLAIRADGSVAAWGANDYGQTNVPANLGRVIAIAAGTWHSVALRTDGTVVVWGDNILGQTNLPAGLSNVTAVAAGGGHTLALRADGTVVAWGDNTDADGIVAGQSVVPWGLTNVVAIGAGKYHSLAVMADGTVLPWGDHSQGQCSPPSGLTNIVAVAGGGAHSVALAANGSVSAWGADGSGQCDLPSTLAPVSGIAAGEDHTAVLLADSIPVPQLLNPARDSSRFSALIQTLSGRNYALEANDSSATSNWTAISTNAGNGALSVLIDPSATASQRFYRMRQW